jgi:beta-glucosidase
VSRAVVALLRRGYDPATELEGASLAGKVALGSGSSFWTTTPYPPANLPSIMLTDGPHGLRGQG